MKNKKNSWDPNLWGGRSKQQVESNYKVMLWTLSSLVVIVCLIALKELILN